MVHLVHQSINYQVCSMQNSHESQLFWNYIKICHSKHLHRIHSIWNINSNSIYIFAFHKLVFLYCIFISGSFLFLSESKSNVWNYTSSFLIFFNVPIKKCGNSMQGCRSLILMKMLNLSNIDMISFLRSKI